MKIRKMWVTLSAFWVGLWTREKIYRLAKTHEELPTKLNSQLVYPIGEKNDLWSLAFLCPCGCNDVIHLNLLEHGDRPSWKITDYPDHLADLSPSVWRKVGCKSHFFLKDGRVQWCCEQ